MTASASSRGGFSHSGIRGEAPSSRSMGWVSWVATQDLQRRVNLNKKDFLARFAGNLDSSGRDGSSVRVADDLECLKKGLAISATLAYWC